MRTIGLIGGMSFESSAVYYRLINELMRERLGGVASAEIVMRSVNFETIVALQKAGDWAGAATRLADAGRSLRAAGADCLLICTNTMHLVAGAVSEAASPIPLINIIDETAKALAAVNRRRPLLLATRYTMEHGFYTDQMRGGGLGLDPRVPDEADRAAVHAIIFEELCAGKVLESSRSRLIAIIEKAAAQGADSVILGCTEICLILDSQALPLPGFDSTEIHARAAVAFALGA